MGRLALAAAYMGTGFVVENRFRKWFPNRAKEDSIDYYMVIFWPLVVAGVGAWVGALYIDATMEEYDNTKSRRNTIGM